MKLLVVGGGGREHALAWKLSQSPLVKKLLVAPGNPGIAACGFECVPIAPNDCRALVEFCLREAVDFVVVGPDQALADGLVDDLSAAGVLTFGPTKAAAELEWSKAFAKDVMQSAGIPTADFRSFREFSAAKTFVETSSWQGWAVKADGLALGKGVVVTSDKSEAIAALSNFLEKQSLGAAGKCVVVEEFLRGPEVSAFYLCDGERGLPLGFACDHKQLLDGGKGPNTGGMGAYSPVSWLSTSAEREIAERIVAPLLAEMRKRGRPFKGMLFVGLMMTASGPRVLEFNARFGDPETQALLPRLGEDLVPYLTGAAQGKMPLQTPVSAGSAVHVVLAAEGYPGTVTKGDKIQGISEAQTLGVEIFFAGVGEGMVTNGGRVLGITALASSQREARRLAYEATDKIVFRGRQLRRDIGAEA